MDLLITLKNIKKNFGKITALENINLEIKPGEVFGLLGLNGAGKTTLIRCMMKLLNPSAGEIFFKNRLLLSQDIQKNFGFLPENFFAPANLTANELLTIFAWGMNLKASRIQACLEQVGLVEQKDKLIKAYSRGMVQRLGLALVLLKEPDIIILDEPTLGLDTLGQAQILSLLRELNKKGKTIFFSSHILAQIEKVCHRIGIIHQGKLIFTGNLKELIHKYNSPSLEEAFLKEVSIG